MKKKSFLNSNRLIVIGIIFLAFFTSCLGMKGGAGKSGKSLYMTFFTEDKSTQYFIKPLKFTNKNKESILCDFTFKNSSKTDDSATINISVISENLLKSIDSIVIKNNSFRIMINKNQFLFTERHKDFFNSRYSFKIPFTDLQKIFDNEEWVLTYYSAKIQGEFYTPKKTKSKLKQLSYEIFDLF